MSSLGWWNGRFWYSVFSKNTHTYTQSLWLHKVQRVGTDLSAKAAIWGAVMDVMLWPVCLFWRTLSYSHTHSNRLVAHSSVVSCSRIRVPNLDALLFLSHCEGDTFFAWCWHRKTTDIFFLSCSRKLCASNPLSYHNHTSTLSPGFFQFCLAVDWLTDLCYLTTLILLLKTARFKSNIITQQWPVFSSLEMQMLPPGNKVERDRWIHCWTILIGVFFPPDVSCNINHLRFAQLSSDSPVFASPVTNTLRMIK